MSTTSSAGISITVKLHTHIQVVFKTSGSVLACLLKGIISLPFNLPRILPPILLLIITQFHLFETRILPDDRISQKLHLLLLLN